MGHGVWRGIYVQMWEFRERDPRMKEMKRIRMKKVKRIKAVKQNKNSWIPNIHPHPSPQAGMNGLSIRALMFHSGHGVLYALRMLQSIHRTSSHTTLEELQCFAWIICI